MGISLFFFQFPYDLRGSTKFDLFMILLEVYFKGNFQEGQ